MYLLEESKRGRIHFEILSKNQKTIHLHRFTNGGDETKGSKWRTFMTYNSIENMENSLIVVVGNISSGVELFTRLMYSIDPVVAIKGAHRWVTIL